MRSIIFHYTDEDTPYLPRLKPLLAGRAKTYLDNTNPTTATEFVIKAKSRDAAVVTTSQALLKFLKKDVSNPKIDDYAGSLITFGGVEFLILDPLKQLVTKATGKFIFTRFLSKLIAPEEWRVWPDFRWELYTRDREELLLEFFRASLLIAIDIETAYTEVDDRRVINCLSYTGVFIDGDLIATMTVVVPLESWEAVYFMRRVNSLPNPKVMQNGKYDNAYFIRYNSPVTNYSFDTINLFHSWLSELPKDLGFISAFLLRDYQFHKNDGNSGDKIDYYGYNAKDTYTTLFCCLQLLFELPDYALKNYQLEFPVVYPCILSEHTGIKWDKDRAFGENGVKKALEKVVATDLFMLQKMVATPGFNPGSYKQVLEVFKFLGSGDIKATTPPEKDKVANRHPLNKRIIDRIISYRENAKTISSYFKPGVEWKGRVFYALNPHGTDTGRLASKESQFWCGFQIQNIPRDEEPDSSVKQAFIVDEDFFFGEADYSQAEARDTAYLSGDENLIAAVDDETKDFHGMNASKFFGIPYDEIVSSVPTIDQEGRIIEWVHKIVAKALRDLAKRVNHGANYNMGPGVMLDTMGIQKVLTAKRLLKLPLHWSLIRVTTHLLDIYSETYAVVKGPWYDKVMADVCDTGFLVGPTGWTRRCFADPRADKRALNSYVAHPPQSLNAMTLNKAVIRVFNEVWLPNPREFKLHAQIHDSIFFSYRRSREDLAWKVKQCMDMSIPVTDTFGIKRELRVPVDLKGRGTRWSNLQPLKEKVA